MAALEARRGTCGPPVRMVARVVTGEGVAAYAEGAMVEAAWEADWATAVESMAVTR